MTETTLKKLGLGEHWLLPRLAAADYHGDALLTGDECPALSASRATAALTRSPAAMIHRVAEPVEVSPPQFRIGQALHSKILHEHDWAATLHIEDVADWKSPKARDNLAEFTRQGFTVLNRKEEALVNAMHAAFLASPVAAQLTTAAATDPEVSIFWRRAEAGRGGATPVLKCRPDMLPGAEALAEGVPIIDIKSVASLDKWERSAFWDYGTGLRLALYHEGIAAALGVSEFNYTFLLIEKEPPHFPQLRTARLGGANETLAVTNGRKMLDLAWGIWEEGLNSGQWPGPLPALDISEEGPDPDRGRPAFAPVAGGAS